MVRSCQKAIALVVKVQECVLDETGDVFSIEPAGTETHIELSVDLLRQVLAKTKKFRNVPGQAVGKPECHELRRFGRIEVRQVAS
jgi:hypothetical protein